MESTYPTTTELHAQSTQRGFTQKTSQNNTINMQLTKILAAVVLPLVAVAQDASDSTTTATSTITLTRTIKLAKVVATTTSTIYNTTSSYALTGTGSSTIVLPTTTGSPTTATPVISPTIDPNAGVALNAANVALAGFAGIFVAALM